MGYGFDNIGDVLTLPPILFEKYLAAAETIAEPAIVATTSPTGASSPLKAEAVARPGNGQVHGDRASG